jgi:hypothetical protein
LLQLQLFLIVERMATMASASASPPSQFTPLVGVLDMQDSQKKSISSLCKVVREQRSVRAAARATLSLTSDLLQAHALYSNRMNAPDFGDNSLAVDEAMMLDVEFLDWFFSKVSAVRVEQNYR